MKKSIFSKLMVTYCIILVISYSLVAVFLSYWFYNNYYNQKRQSLISEGSNLSSMLSDYMQEDLENSQVVFKLDSIDRLIDARIWILDKYGFVKMHSGEEADQIEDMQITGREFAIVSRGKIVVSRTAFSNMFGSKMLSVGVPVMEDGQVVGSVFLHSSVEGVSNTLERVFFVIWTAAFFAIIISAFIIYYFSDRIIIRPLEKINATAKAISKGEFDERVSLVSDDEVGDLAKSFNYMADSVQNLENMRKSFIANVSHELRSPMTSINGFIVGMQDGTIPQDKWPYYLDIVHGEIQRLIRLINNLLDLSSLESGKFSLNIGVFDINALIRERIIKFEDKINKKSINVDVIITEGKQNVAGDRDRIDQVLTNLIDNAIKFVPENGDLGISTELKDDKLLVSVYNSGKGISQEDIKYIWDRFHMGDKARSKGAGTGLGLSIARQIINQHKENIWVESTENSTVFTFTIAVSE
jgi:signal transduction histidine kinase